jgi:Glyoxalase-like domain
MPARGSAYGRPSLPRLDGSLDSRETGRMPLGWKLVIDSTNAPALADFWAAALEYEVEDPSALVSQLLAAGHIGSEAVVYYRGRRIFRGYAAIRHPEDPFDETSGIGRGRRLLFQEVPERKSGKNRLHIDVHSEPGASTSWLPGWRSWGQPAWARSMRDLRDAGGSCKTPKAMSSALRKPGRRA